MAARTVHSPSSAARARRRGRGIRSPFGVAPSGLPYSAGHSGHGYGHSGHGNGHLGHGNGHLGHGNGHLGYGTANGDRPALPSLSIKAQLQKGEVSPRVSVTQCRSDWSQGARATVNGYGSLAFRQSVRRRQGVLSVWVLAHGLRFAERFQSNQFSR